MKKEDLKIGAFVLVPKEFFTNKRDGLTRLFIERNASVREDGKIMCAIVEDIESITREGPRFEVRIRTVQDAPDDIPYIGIYVYKDEDFSSWELLSYEEAFHLGIRWSLCESMQHVACRT